MWKFRLCFHHEAQGRLSDRGGLEFWPCKTGTGDCQFMANIGLGNLEDIMLMGNITEVGLQKTRRECMDWILLA